ncbi:MAG: 4-(cytidine 5'-diphospho)-2-C-methyl-D-erythritol kinase [Treponema sp.]|jgi:4-diphosphocytidyl-2-C-methyl-D-erythritol kinase|nr:4-(cytidine 5'-diphospho)-2-C-methyl-D-erythritol kinase [Treponema sp.]
MPSVHLDAPCKINLHLRVKERRSDGFHELESIFLALAFGDTLHVEVGNPGQADGFMAEYGLPPGYKREAGGIFGDIPRRDNSLLKAAALFRARTGFDRPLRMRLEKRVPMGAGLGGGSSDGAAALLALNELAKQAGHPKLLDGPGLERAAAELGSDAPFFLGVLTAGAGGAAWVSGRGERIRPIEGPPDCTVALANPGFPSHTMEAYRLLDARRNRQGAPLRAGPSERDLIEALRGPPSRWPYENDFLEVFFEGSDAPSWAYRTILEEMQSHGADFCGLTGSGSTCFGIFTQGGAAEKAAEAVRSRGFSLKSGSGCLPEREFFTVLTFPLAYLGKRVLL